MILEYKGHKPQIAPDVFIAPNATIIGKVEIQAGANVWFGAVLRGDHGRIVIGAGTSVQDNSVIHAPLGGQTIVGQNVIIGHGSVLEGCTIGDGVVVGMSSTVLHNVTVGEMTMLAAGTVVPDGMQIPARVLAAGVPAKVKKELEGKTLGWVEHGAAAYHELAADYLAMFGNGQEE